MTRGDVSSRSLERHGFRPRGYAAPRYDNLENTTWFGPICSQPTTCSTPTTSNYFIGYDDIVAELEAMDGITAAVTLAEIGISYVDGRRIYGVQFGPLEEVSNPPTLYVLATYHAREWLTTAVSLQLARWLNELVTAGTIDGVPDFWLAQALTTTAIVIVPVVNPDGYEHSRNGFRSWRGNRNTATCNLGVDLNRNHTTAWSEPAAGTTSNCSETFRGSSAGSESETQAVEHLLTGGAFPKTQVPVALISYHAFADMIVYPDGYKQVADAEGPHCGLTNDNNCFNADFTVLRDLFGDTHSSLFVDDVSYLPTVLEFPYYRDHGSTVLYGVSGDVNLHATYGPTPILAITPELPSACYGFGIECDPRADDVVLGTAADQLRVIRRVMPAASELASSNPSTAYGPKNVGTFSSGLWTREYRGANSAQAARATFVKSVFLPASSGSLTAQIGQDAYTYDRGRRGAQYELYSLTLANEPELNAMCLPCEISTSTTTGESVDVAVNCSGCIDLCDPDRLSASGWELRTGTRGGAADCWWTATAANGVLVVPTSGAPQDASHCHMTFSVEWGPLTGSQIYIERQTSTGWETVMTARYEQPYNGGFFPSDRLLSYAFEANNLLGSGLVPAFRFRVDGAAPASETVRIFDPVVYCRLGALP
jgi:hypothetical protein